MPSDPQTIMRTQIGIVGAGPAGLTLSHLLARAGIDSVVIEKRSREYVIERVRAGVLEQGTVALLSELGLSGRLERESLTHRGIEIRFDDQGHRIDLAELTAGRSISVYGQNELVKDLIEARVASAAPLYFAVDEVSIEGIDSDTPRIRFLHDDAQHRVDCDFIAGCDGFHGICRASIPPQALTIYEHVYPFAWLGIMVEAPPACDELCYAHHDRGFALASMRTPQLTRLHLQCAADDDLDRWPDARIWEEIHTRCAAPGRLSPNVGPIIQKGIAPLRSFVADPMQHGRLYLAGDAAHIVPPTGAKGLNLAVADVRVLARGFERKYRANDDTWLANYSRVCLERVWRVQRFSAWMTSLLHRFPQDDAFQRGLRHAERAYLVSSRAAMASLAENYVGLPLPDLD